MNKQEAELYNEIRQELLDEIVLIDTLIASIEKARAREEPEGFDFPPELFDVDVRLKKLNEMLTGWSEDDWERASYAINMHPDPDTGLVNCGCGGSAGAWEQQIRKGVKHYVECESCEISTADYDAPQEAITAWNRAMGYLQLSGTQEVPHD